MILVTGAAGKTGSAVLRVLSSQGMASRALIRRPEQQSQVEATGAAEVVIGDLLDSSVLTRAMKGASAVYLIVPNVHPEEKRIGSLAIRAARAAGIDRFAYHSVLHPQVREMPHHWQKLAVEERLIESGLAFTILQPAAYMQNVAAYWDDIVSEGVYRVPYGEGGAISLVDLEDVAQVAAMTLTETGHAGATYELAGPEALSPADIARAISLVLRKPVVEQEVDLSDWVAQARESGLSGYALESLTRMFNHYDRHGFMGNPRVLENLLGRAPLTFAGFVERLHSAATP
jgi:uncharacterized protein YbjT (DUF2867 family)